MVVRSLRLPGSSDPVPPFLQDPSTFSGRSLFPPSGGPHRCPNLEGLGRGGCCPPRPALRGDRSTLAWNLEQDRSSPTGERSHLSRHWTVVGGVPIPPRGRGGWGPPSTAQRVGPSTVAGSLPPRGSTSRYLTRLAGVIGGTVSPPRPTNPTGYPCAGGLSTLGGGSNGPRGTVSRRAGGGRLVFKTQFPRLNPHFGLGRTNPNLEKTLFASGFEPWTQES